MTDGIPPRLSAQRAAGSLPYDRGGVTPGIVHLGVGAFHRAHMAVYVDDILKSDPSWGIIGASLRHPDTRNALAPQDFLYTLAVRDGASSTTRVIGSLLDILDAPASPARLLEAMCDPRIRIVSLTITEKGYCHDPATGALDKQHPDIVRDVANPAAPVSALGFIVRALQLRRAAGVPPFTVLCCDNLPANGDTTRRVTVGFATLLDPELARFIDDNVAFPSTMVDRIVPATTSADRAFVRQVTGVEDASPVVTEPFTQWVVEDHFTAGRPAFETVGVEMMRDVRPFELMKLRMLNGSHSTIAYLGYLAGYDLVSDAMGDPAFRALVHGLMTEEVMPTLPYSVGDVNAYRDALLARFANPALKHRTWQIAMDGSQKLPQRLLGTIRDRLKAGQPFARLALGVAAWMRYASGRDEQDNAIDVRDPLSEKFKQLSAKAGASVQQLVADFLAITEIFGNDLPRNEPFRDTVAAHLATLLDAGSKATVRRVVEATQSN